MVSPGWACDPKTDDFSTKIAKCRYCTITQYLLYGSCVLAMKTAPTYRYFRTQNPPKILMWHTPSSKTSRYRTFCSQRSYSLLQDVLRCPTPCSMMAYSMLQDVLLLRARGPPPSYPRLSPAGMGPQSLFFLVFHPGQPIWRSNIAFIAHQAPRCLTPCSKMSYSFAREAKRGGLVGFPWLGMRP